LKGKWFASWRLSDESNQLKEQTRSESSMKECSWLDMLGKRLLRGCLLGVHWGETSSKNKRLIPQSNFMARYQLLWQGNQYWWGCWKDVRWHTSYSRSPGREGINEKLQLPNHHYFLYNKIKIKIKINFFFILCVIIPSRKIHIVCGMFFRTFSHTIHQGLASNPCPSMLYSTSCNLWFHDELYFCKVAIPWTSSLFWSSNCSRAHNWFNSTSMPIFIMELVNLVLLHVCRQ